MTAPHAGEELDRVEHEDAERGAVEDRGRERAAEGPRTEQAELDDRGVQEIRSELSAELTRHHMRWREVDALVRPLLSQGTG